MKVVLYTSAGGFLFETKVTNLDGSPFPMMALPEVWLWSGLAFIRNDMYLKLTGAAGYVEATVGTLPARTDAP